MAVAALAAPLASPSLTTQAGAAGDWPAFGGDPGNSKYSTLDQIDRDNFQDVKIAWHWRSIAADTEVPDSVRRGQFKTIPIEVGGRVFVATSLGQVAAIDAATGDTLWTWDPESWRVGRPANEGFQHRGVAYWTDGERERVLLPTHHRRLVSLDAATGAEDDLIDWTPELRAEALEIAGDYDLVPLYTPPRVKGEGKPTLQLPSEGGGTNWTGAAVDPETGVLYVPSYTLPVTVSLTRPDPNRSNLNFVPERWYQSVDGPRGLPLVKPPYGRITAIDLNTGEHLWMVPHGVGPVNHPAIAHLKLGRLGKVNHQPAPLVTPTLLFVTASSEHSGDPEAAEPDTPPEISVYDKETGEYLGGIELPDTPHSNLISYEHGGRQYLAVATGGGRYYGGGGTPPVLVALALPQEESGS